MDNDNYLRVGVVVKTHGLRGELTVFPTTDDPTRFKKLKECLIFVNGEEYKFVTLNNMLLFLSKNMTTSMMLQNSLRKI